MLPPPEPGWSVLSADRKFANPHLAVHLVSVATPLRPEPRPWTIVRRKKGVALAPFTADGRLLLIRQERIPCMSTLWEFPAGQIDLPDSKLTEDAIHATAHRELLEETGHHLAPGGALIPLGTFYTSQGFTDERMLLFAARPVQPHPDGPQHESNEVIAQCRPFALDEIRRMIRDNVIQDGNSLALFSRLTVHGLI